LLGARPVADDSPAQVIISPMMPRILGEEFEAVLQQASEMPAAVPSPQLSASEVRAYKRGLRAMRDEMKRAKKAAEAAEAAEARAAAMASPAEVAEAVAELLEELVYVVAYEEDRRALFDARVALGPFSVHSAEASAAPPRRPPSSSTTPSRARTPSRESSSTSSRTAIACSRPLSCTTPPPPREPTS
jgi:hypothetical protein